jgi:hypothetical protein
MRMLSSKDCAFFIHIDKKSCIQDFSIIAQDNTFISDKRIPVYWGEFSQVEATIGLIRDALSYPKKFDYFILLQGSDYPLRNSIYIQQFLETHYGSEFISAVQMPSPGFPLSKVNGVRYPSDKPFRRFASRALSKVALGQRDYKKFLGHLEPYAGDACWALSREACDYILSFAGENPHYERYFRNTFTSDEVFFHTILGNSQFRTKMRRSIHFRDWPANQRNHPAMLNEEHVKFFESQEKIVIDDEWGVGELLFARKFSDDSLGLIDRIDKMIERKGQK